MGKGAHIQPHDDLDLISGTCTVERELTPQVVSEFSMYAPW